MLDWACDSRVAAAMASPRRHGPAGVLTPEDLILAFSDGNDHDHNGYANDIAGWNYVDNNNDPYDDVQYGHGSGEAQDSTAEADTGGHGRHLPQLHDHAAAGRASRSSTDANRFAQAALYATDMGADVIQEALGTYNAPYFARQAIEYAYDHGTTVIASAADEAAEHHNQPGLASRHDRGQLGQRARGEPRPGQRHRKLLPAAQRLHQLGAAGRPGGRGLLLLLGVDRQELGRHRADLQRRRERAGRRQDRRPATDCRRVDGTPCIITPNEVRQLLASGNIAGDATAGQATPSARHDAGRRGQRRPGRRRQLRRPAGALVRLEADRDLHRPQLNTTFNRLDPTQPGGVIGARHLPVPGPQGL